ncbi:hypothetical protein CcrBL47_gp518 [Caulobacter phage BL47]|nr:hypothetical protein CcrBL47_gp002 [Caulobacter phage BL47]UTU09800.1 hypothetical protein CcrBL47_gp518 [Caulobacter phage BL47]UTU09864.1 hypothetical protein CcrRB23_gp002 [Caulobacter phage RB23]UTU10358.1 hypothetical protein CcrRB23_gp496 [Caulobacter phage RB23]
MLRYLSALFDHIVHYKLAPAHLKVENQYALERLKAVDREIAAGRYEGADLYGSRSWTFWRLSPTERLKRANKAIEGRYGRFHAGVNLAAPITPARPDARDRRVLGHNAAYDADLVLGFHDAREAVDVAPAHIERYPRYSELPASLPAHLDKDSFLDSHPADTGGDPFALASGTLAK